MSTSGGSNAPLLTLRRTPQSYDALVDAFPSGIPTDIDIHDADSYDDQGNKRATKAQTFVNLVKGYLLGNGVLILPWAMSQLGMLWGILSIILLAFWESYNCWTLVRIKRYVDLVNHSLAIYDHDGSMIEDDDEQDLNSEADDYLPVGTNEEMIHSSGEFYDRVDSLLSTASTIKSHATYATMGGWAYGARFHDFVRASMCFKQLCICCILISFCGENITYFLKSFDIPGLAKWVMSRWAGLAFAMILVIPLCMLPDARSITCIFHLVFMLQIVGLVFILALIVEQWGEHFVPEIVTDRINVCKAIGAILYAFDGMNWILPTEAAMKEPKFYRNVYWTSTIVVVTLFLLLATISNVSFGRITEGSITAFLLEVYSEDHGLYWQLFACNTSVTLSIILIYPLQFAPALKVLAPWLNRKCGCGNNYYVDDGMDAMPPIPEEMESRNTGSKRRKGNDDPPMSSNIFIMEASVIKGDSVQLRLLIVFGTFLVAGLTPNVQTLVSLVGAFACALTSLIIPPLLELALIRELKETGVETNFTADTRLSQILLVLSVLFLVVVTCATLYDIIQNHHHS